jgi:hypothetical protein
MAKIGAFGNAIGKTPTFNLDAGLYRCTVDATSTKLSCVKLSGSSGGSHELFWGVFGERISEVTSRILSGPLTAVDAQSVWGQLVALDRLICRYGTSYKWLSAVRNDIQYKHQHSVWFPTTINKRDRDDLSRLASLWKSDPMIVNLDAERFGALGEFIVACAFIIGLSRVLLTRIAERAPFGQQSFLQFGPIAFLNDRQMGAT